MSVYLIGYDLNRPRGIDDYQELIDAIKAYGTWWHHLDSTFLIKTNSATSTVRDDLKKHIDNGDELLVIKVTGTWASSGFSQKATDWLKNNLD